jgi:hypothetical protein
VIAVADDLCCIAESRPCHRHIPIPRRIADHVLAHFGHGGYQAGSFTRNLILTIASADPGNQRKLALGFPEYVAAVQLAQLDDDGITRLQAISAAEAGGPS